VGKKKRRLQKLLVKAYESGTKHPVVVHTFVGETRAEATQYHKAHLKTDAFLRDCTRRGRWDGISCRVERRWQRRRRA
jgi:hypothetical protein